MTPKELHANKLQFIRCTIVSLYMICIIECRVKLNNMYPVFQSDGGPGHRPGAVHGVCLQC